MSSLPERARSARAAKAAEVAANIQHQRAAFVTDVADHFALYFHTPLPAHQSFEWPGPDAVDQCALVVDGVTFRVRAGSRDSFKTVTVVADVPCPQCGQRDGGREVEDLADLGDLLERRCRLCAATTSPCGVTRPADLTYVTDRGVFQVIREGGEYPGLRIHVNDELAAVVEWNPLHAAYVTRLYSPSQDEPVAQYTLTGTVLDPET